MKRINAVFVIVLFLMSACAGGAPPAEYPAEEPQAAPVMPPDDFMPTAAMMPVNSPRPNTPLPLTPDTSPVATPFYSPYSKDDVSPIFFGIFHNFVLLGATTSGQWLQAQDVYGLFYEDGGYDFYYGSEYIGAGTAHIIQPVSFGPPGYCNYFSATQSVMGGEPPSFGLKQGQPAALRQVEEISIDTPIYQSSVAEWLALQEVPSPTVNITRILRVDLEGDGVDEVLISASHFLEETGHMVVEGDYSLVLMRKAIGNSIYTVPLVQDIYYGNTPLLEFPKTYSLDAVFDLNGDGRLEVIVAETWWEGSGYSVYEVRGIHSMEVLRLRCSL